MVRKKKKGEKSFNHQIYVKDLLESEKNISLNDLEERAFEDLEKYITSLDKMQKEKE